MLEPVPARLPDGDGRSKRQRFRPLDFWKGETVVYGRRDSAQFACIVDVMVAEKEPELPKKRAPKRAAKGVDSQDGPLALMPPPPTGLSDDHEAESPVVLMPPPPAPGIKRVKKQAKKATA